ncbi:MAG: protein kinase [Polyangiaceae bacterium]|nr:protein kinase [Polyangiaceae bacterium]
MSFAAIGVLLGGRYLLERRLAEGGMGAVWRARHIKLDVPVVVKVMTPVLASSSEARTRFEREAKAAARLTSPHVVEVHDYGVEGDTPYIVMEHLEGQDLAMRLAARGHLRVDETAEVIDQIAKALDVAHAAGVVHRDLKPSNVFLAKTGREEVVKVLDFGVAKLRSEPGISTLPGMVMGSPSYMSPEQTKGATALDYRSDLWSLGVVAFECLTGALPFDRDDVTDLIIAISQAPVPSVTSFAPWLNPELNSFFVRALSRPVATRFQSALELAEAFVAAAGLPARVRSTFSSQDSHSVGESAGARLSLSTGSLHSEKTVALRAKPSDDISTLTGAPKSKSRSGAALANVGEVIAGRFEVLSAAGEGSMGVVFHTHDKVTGSQAALKLFRPSVVDTSRFFQEAHALSESHHPAVVRYVAHGVTSEGQPYLAMEWVDGISLAMRLKLGPLGVTESLVLAIRLAEGLGAVHRNGIVHGDLTPSNILLSSGRLEDAKIIDFGISHRGKNSRLNVSQPLQVTGTPGYLAPEQALAGQTTDSRADVFSLGCVLFECLAGRSPFAADSAFAAIGKLTAAPVPRLSDIMPTAPAGLDALLGRLLAHNRESRPENGADAAALMAAVHDLEAPVSRGREGMTQGERKLVPVVLVVPAASLPTLPTVGLQLAADAAQDDATLNVTTDVVARNEQLTPIARRYQCRVEIVQGGAFALIGEGAGLLVDQATQAALCALAVHAAFPDSAVSVATGRKGKRGGVLDRAAACLVRAFGGGEGAHNDLPPVLDDASFGLLDGRFDIDRSTQHYLLRGRLLREEDQGRLLGKVVPCAGREPELSILDTLYRECSEESTAKVVIIKGPAGAGKSRLRREFLRRLKDRGEVFIEWVGRGDVMNAGSPFAILSNAVHSMLDLAGGEPDDVRRAALREVVARRVPADRVNSVTAFVGEMVGIPFPDDSDPQIEAARKDALLLGDQRRRAFEELLAAECSKSPLVLVLEDLHLSDLPTVKLIDSALRTLENLPLFVVATARESVGDLFPKLWHERVPQEIRVGPLSAKASEKIVRSVLGAAADKDLVSKVVSRAGGHPLHLEEIVRAVAERPGSELPDTVLAVVEARLAALDPAARLVLRAASVFGRTFWQGAVTELTSLRSSTVADWLRDLDEHEWIKRSTLSRFVGETEFVIQQDLVQEAAYAMLHESDRELGHRLAANFLVRSGERDPTVLSRHFELGGDSARAALWLLRAAEQALDGNDFAAAVTLSAKAAALSNDPIHGGRAAAISAEANLHRGELTAAREQAFFAMKHLAPPEPEYFRACSSAVASSGKLGDLESVQKVARSLLELDAASCPPISLASVGGNGIVQCFILGDTALGTTFLEWFDKIAHQAAQTEPLVAAQLARARGAKAAYSGDLYGSIEQLRNAVIASDAAGDMRSACALRKTLGWYLGELGALEEAEKALREAISAADKMGLTSLAPHAKHDLGSPLLRLGKLDEVRISQEEALIAFDLQGDKRLQSSAHALLSAVQLLAGDLDAAEREANLALSLAPSDMIRFTALTRLADAQRARGHHEEAIATADIALKVADETGNIEECLVLCYLVRAESLIQLGQRNEAESTLRRARVEIERRAAGISDLTLRGSFVARIPENARVLELCNTQFQDQGHS